MYFSGRGVDQSNLEALRWWRLPAERGHDECLNNLGAMFANGLGAPRNLIVADALQTVSQAKGNGLATQNLLTKEADMSAADIATAKALAAEMMQPGGIARVLDRYLPTQ